MPLNALTSELMTIVGIPDSGLVEAIVGDTINFLPVAAIGTNTLVAVRKPAAEGNSVAGTSFTFSAPGRSTFTITNAGLSRTIVVLCFPAAALTLPGLAKAPGNIARTAAEQRQILRNIAQDGRISDATSTSSLEAASTLQALGVGPQLVGGGPFSIQNMFAVS